MIEFQEFGCPVSKICSGRTAQYIEDADSIKSKLSEQGANGSKKWLSPMINEEFGKLESIP